MNKTNLINAAVIVLITVISVVIFMATNTSQHATQKFSQNVREMNAEGQACVRDASSHVIPIGDYKKIICLSSALDAFLVRIIDPQRIIGYSHYSKGRPYAAVLQHALTFRNAKQLEAIIAAKPDLIIAPSSAADVSQIDRLREAGLAVFNVGQSSGFDSFCIYAGQIASLLNAASAGERELNDYVQSVRTVASDDSLSQLRVLYLAHFSGNFYGGVIGSSYHDSIIFAGVQDAADDQEWRTGWPQYSIEQLFVLNPEYIICNQDMADEFYDHAALTQLSAVVHKRIIEVESSIMNDPGLGIYEAAKRIRTQIQTSIQADASATQSR